MTITGTRCKWQYFDIVYGTKDTEVPDRRSQLLKVTTAKDFIL